MWGRSFVSLPALALAGTLAHVVHAAEGLAPGVYAVTCDMAGRGKTPAEAKRACARAIRRAGLNPKLCNCARDSDLVRIKPGTRPAFFAASMAGAVGPTREAAIAACREYERRLKRANPGVTEIFTCDQGVVAAYGPFHRRKPVNDDLDDVAVYRYLSDQGYWLDEQGVPTCLAAGTPVLTTSGPHPIEWIRPGEILSSWSVERGEETVGKVVRVKGRSPAHPRSAPAKLRPGSGLTTRRP